MANRTEKQSQKMREPSAHPGFWMRSVQFAGLHRILHRVAEFDSGIRVKDLNRLIVEKRDYLTERGEPSKTTLYHCRNTLLQLGALKRRSLRIEVAQSNPHVVTLLDEPADEANTMSLAACEAFSALVLHNTDCYQNFVRLFLPDHPAPTVEQFREQAGSVVWKQVHDTGQQVYELHSQSSGDMIVLSAPIPIRSILYGVRDWACKQLRMCDEFFDVGRGSVIFPIRHPDNGCNESAAQDVLLATPTDGSEWTTVSIRELLCTFCEQDGYPVHVLFDGIREFVHTHSGFVSLIPTIPTFATITATSRKRADFELVTAFRELGDRGRFISHIRFHNSLRERYAQEEAPAQVDYRQ